MKRTARRFLYSLALSSVMAAMLFFPNHITAQFTTASLSGNVVDQSGASIPDAKITVQNVDTGFTQSVNTGPAGEYLFSRLPVGKYKLTVEKSGFTGYVQTGIELAVSQTATQSVILKIGAIAQEVAVSADASLVTTESATISQVVSQRQIVELPLDGRQVQQLVFLGPVSRIPRNIIADRTAKAAHTRGSSTPKASGTIVGKHQLSDGWRGVQRHVRQHEPAVSQSGRPPGVQRPGTNMSAEYGNAVGGVVNVVTKSGTNQIHGDVFEFLRNGDMNARNFFAPAQDQIKRNQFGGSVGGPILKDQLFYFGTYQGTRYANAPQGNIAFVPTAQERTGNFSDLPGVQLVDPLNNNLPFAGNQIPASRLSSVSQYLLKYLPLPNGAGQEINYLGPSQRWADDQFMIKGDYIKGKNQISLRYFFTNFNQQPLTNKADLLQVDGNGNQVRVQNIRGNLHLQRDRTPFV